MRVMIDTHVWVFHVSQMNDQLSGSARAVLKDAEVLFVSAISCWEVALLVHKGRLGIDNVSEWIQNALRLSRVQLLDLSPEALVNSVFLGGLHKDPADRMIIATSLIRSLPLVTADKRIHAWNEIETIW